MAGSRSGAFTAHDVARDATGAVKFQQEGTASASTSQTGVAVMATVGGSDRVNFDRVKGAVTMGSGTMVLKRNGAQTNSGATR